MKNSAFVEIILAVTLSFVAWSGGSAAGGRLQQAATITPASMYLPIIWGGGAPTPAPSATASPTSTNTSLPTIITHLTATATPTWTATATDTKTPPPTRTTTAAETSTATDTPTSIPTSAATATSTTIYTATPTPSPIITATGTSAVINTSTPPPTPTPTGTSAAIGTATPTATATETATATDTPEATPTPTLPWITIKEERFEDGFPAGWEVFDNLPGNGEYFWDKRDCRAYEGSYSGWAVGGGTDGASLACMSEYPDLVESWMVYGPFSLMQAKVAELSAMVLLNTQKDKDRLQLCASKDNSSYGCVFASGLVDDWQERKLDLAHVPLLGSLLGEPRVWVALIFVTDANTHLTEGAYVDNVVVHQLTH